LEVCEQKAISKPGDSTSSVYVISEKCDECGECVKVCPTGAINLEEEEKSVSVGQIISFYPIEQREGVYVIDEKNDAAGGRAAALRTVQNINGYKKEKFILSDLEKCANHPLMEKKLNVKGCTYCEDACAYYPVKSGVVSDLACKGCGACSTSCPQNTLDLNFQSFDDLLKDVDNTTDVVIKPKIVMFTCLEGGYSTLKAAGLKGLKYPPAIPIFVPCLGNVSEEHILRAFDVGAEGVLLLGCGTKNCTYGKGFTRGSKSVGNSKKILSFFGIGGERVRMLSGDGTEPEKFANQLNDFESKIKGLKKNPLSKKKPSNIEDLEEKWSKKREIFHSLLSGFALKTGVSSGEIAGDLPVGIVKVDEGECTLCGACVYHCNTGAFRYEGDEIIDIFNTHTYCIGCGICEEICPENVISLKKAINLESFTGKVENKFDVKIINCSRCGKPLMAEAALKKLTSRLKEKDLGMLELCQNCIDKDTVGDIIKAEQDDFIIIQQGKSPWDS
jgi:coenzyme F420-reducing hydrogenase delta subunit/NAD-dependent dihydropyrimidine dehydrogenase PreA subunit